MKRGTRGLGETRGGRYRHWPVSVHHAELNACGLPAFVEDAQLIPPLVFKWGVERSLMVAVAHRLTIEKPPAPTVSTQGRDREPKRGLTCRRAAQTVAVANPCN